MNVESNRDRARFVLELVTTAAMLIASVLLVWIIVRGPANPPAQRRSAVPVPQAPIELAGNPFMGSPSAKVAILQYSDYQCPFCVKFEQESLPALLKTYIVSGKVRLVARHMPLDKLHPFARRAAESAVCADRQGKFWEMHSRLFAKSKELDDAYIRSGASDLLLDTTRFEECLQADGKKKVEADSASAAALGIGGTPAFVLGVVQPDGRLKASAILAGARPLSDFQAELDRLLERTK